jgi:tripartite-type tricarboxylate transporter receptor subunit TctC
MERAMAGSIATRWGLALTALLWFSTAANAAEKYPDRPIHLIVPYAAGGPSDTITRIISKSASEILGQPIIIENNGGAGGIIGANTVARATPDGYTIGLLSPGQVGIAVATRSSVPYDPKADFVPVIELVEDTLILCVSNALKVSDVRELVSYMKAHPGELNYSSASVGSMTHMVMELFKQTVGVDAVHVPYKNASQATLAVITGEVSLAFSSPSGIMPFLSESKVKPLAIASAHRSSVVSAIPTMAEMGFQNLDSPLWYILAAPKGTPPESIEALYEAYAAALQTPQVKERMTSLGVDIVGAGPDVVEKLIDTDIARWKTIVKAANIKLD